MKIVLRVLKEAKKYWFYIFAGILAVIVSTLASLYTPWVLQELTKLIIEGDKDIVLKSRNLGLILLSSYILMGICSYIRGYFTHYAAYHYVADLRKGLYDKVQHLSMKYFTETQTGQIASRIMHDSVNAEILIAHVIPDLIVNALMFISISIILFYININLALVSLISIPFLIVVNMGYSKYVLPLWRLNSKAVGELNGTLQDNLSGIKEIQVFNQQKYETKKIGDLARKQTNVFLKATKLGEIFNPFIVLLSSIGSVIVIIYGGYLNSIGSVSAADIVGFIMYLNLFYRPINNLSALNEQLNTAIAGCERVYEIMDTKMDVKESPNAVNLKNVKGAIEFKDVSFYYKKEIPVLKSINIKINPGDTVAFVGTTGVGKTTLASLLNRFYDPVEGAILIDNINIKNVSLTSLRDNISMVLQDTYLFSGTVYENIVYGLEYATKEQVMNAAVAANAHDFIIGFENGYDTLIGERGIRLSGGQKQRLSIARAVLRNSPILILDEATSSLDSKTEKEIQSALDNISVGRTTFVIAHRLSTIKNADMIVVLDRTGVAESGTHDELIKAGGKYSSMYLAQAS